MKTSESILCRSAIQITPTASGVMMYMPGGMQTITPFEGGKGQPITVAVDARGAAARTIPMRVGKIISFFLIIMMKKEPISSQ